MSKDESTVEQEISIRAKYFNCTLMRNNSGAFKDNDGRVVFFGLGNTSAKRNREIKSSDRIGFTEVIVTPEMVGKKIAVFTAIEVKKESWNPDKKLDEHEIAQNNFLQFITSRGGIAGFVNSVDGLTKIFGQWWNSFNR
jgi:hypothetical protein